MMTIEDEKRDLEERLAFLGFTEGDRKLLANLAPLLESHADRFVAAFYRHLLSFEVPRRLLADPEVKDRLLQKQREYLLSLGGPEVDLAYAAERTLIGEAHERVGLGTRWYLGAYSLYFSLLTPMICEAHRGEPEFAERTVTALMKLLMLDAQLAMEAYIRKREELLETLNRELALTQRELAQEVDDQSVELRRTERRAVRAEELASTAVLIAGLAHEVGTPMGVIRGHAEALESAVEGDRAKWRLRTIREQIDRIAKIIEVLLNIARPKESVRAPVPLAEVIDSTLVFVGEKLRRREIQVDRSYDAGSVVIGDPEKLQQLFLNLFLNAADAMPEGGALRVHVANVDAEHVQVRVSESGVEIRVRDTGLGIHPDVLPRIFEPFFTTKPSGRGSGLGLVVVRNIVEEHGGQIEVDSEMGEGTEFRILLPAAPDQSPDSQPNHGS